MTKTFEELVAAYALEQRIERATARGDWAEVERLEDIRDAKLMDQLDEEDSI